MTVFSNLRLKRDYNLVVRRRYCTFTTSNMSCAHTASPLAVCPSRRPLGPARAEAGLQGRIRPHEGWCRSLIRNRRPHRHPHRRHRLCRRHHSHRVAVGHGTTSGGLGKQGAAAVVPQPDRRVGVRPAGGSCRLRRPTTRS